MFIGIVTYNRSEKFKELLLSIDNLGVEIFCIKDGGGNSLYEDNSRLIQLNENIGVGRCKNLIIDKFLQSKEEHLFILEDDIKIKNTIVFDECIKFKKESGIRHFNWNSYRDKGFTETIEYKNYKCHAYNNTEANFSYFHRSFVEKIRFDENFKNAWEHIELLFQGSLIDFVPPFWYFVSPEILDHYLECNDDGISTITNIGKYSHNLTEGIEYFNRKYGYGIGQIPKVSKDLFIQSLKRLQENENTIGV